MVNDDAGASDPTEAPDEIGADCGTGTIVGTRTAAGTGSSDDPGSSDGELRGEATGAESGAVHVRVLLVDDEALMRSGLRLMLDGARGIEVVGEARDGQDALDQLPDLAPDVVLMDIRMPRMTGVEALRVLRDRDTPPRVVMLTAFDTDAFLLEALRAGAAGFLLKDSPPEEVVEAVLDAAADRPRVAPDVLRRLMRLAAGSSTPGTTTATRSSALAPCEDPRPAGSPAPAPEGITEREWEVARLVAQGLANPEIGASLFMSVATVKTHLGRLYQKLQVVNRVQLAIRVLELDG